MPTINVVGGTDRKWINVDLKKLMKKSVSGAVVGAAALALLLGGTQPVTAAPSASLAPELVAELTSVWTEHEVPADVQDALILKMESGEVPDSMKNLQPVSVEDITTQDSEYSQVQRFADGSINLLGFEAPSDSAGAGEFSTRSVDGCSQSGFRYNDCRVYGWFTSVQMAFRATYVLGKNAAQIISYSQPTVQCFPGIICQTPFFSLTRQKQSGSLSAQVSEAVTWSIIGVGGGSTTYLHLYVKDQSASSN